MEEPARADLRLTVLTAVLIPLLFAPPTEPDPLDAQTTVELRVTSVDEPRASLMEQELRRRLGDRLLEDGYRVLPEGREAQVQVWVHVESAETVVEAHGAASVREEVAGGDPNVVLLEVQHVAVALVDRTRPRERTDEGPAAVMVDLAGEADDPELLERLQVGLLERGHVLTREAGPADQRLCVFADAEEVSVEVTSGASTCSDEGAGVDVPPGETVERARQQLLDVAAARLRGHSEAAREADAKADVVEAVEEAEERTATPMPAPNPEREPALAVPSVPDDLDLERDRDSLALDITARGTALGRTGGLDALVGGAVRFGRQTRLGGGLDFGFSPSRGEFLQVREYLPTAFLDWRFHVRRFGYADLGAHGGVHVHTYRQTSEGGARGTRVGGSAFARVRVGWNFAPRGPLLFLGLRGGVSGQRVVHLLGTGINWTRGGVFAAIGGGMGWNFALGGGRRSKETVH